ncbi:MAG: glutamate 5-kinase [Alphaproteobacteria bacterium]|jgi:glutamate 5-kinase|nr:glutamate 5-kinase [Rhodospirillaceae bacterium]MBT6512735.1 glutamate 5-kinase [Rhodospirillaceae bacterium]MBT7647072.1 glutamate 5-kinase [Rhodospirillaceae bacterium]MDG2481888.1 glutamate 5-kinase [Alphaproteobacteria bacterium]
MTSGLDHARRIVVKIGSALLVEGQDGRIHRSWLNALADDIADLRRDGREVLIVTSGAIAIGRRLLGLTAGTMRLEESQAAAASGQIRLAHAYQEALGRHEIGVAQLLLTLDDTEDRRRYLNALNTLNTLLRMGAVPIVNENDTVATGEIRFGDNDRLAARVSMMASADALVLLSDIDGLYDRDPKTNNDVTMIHEVEAITPEIMAMGGKARAGDSSGGMETKLIAARIATQAGCNMAIADGRIDHPLRAMREGKPCTWFLARDNPTTARKRWIAGALKPSGSVTVDAGALTALGSGRSLLPAGVTSVEGSFDRGDAVVLNGPDGLEVGRGLVAYSCADARTIAGHKSGEIELLLGYRGREELIHRDDLVMA